MEKNLIKPHHEGGSQAFITLTITSIEPYQQSQIHNSYDQAGQCEYLIVTLADSMLEPIIPKARESKKFIDK